MYDPVYIERWRNGKFVRYLHSRPAPGPAECNKANAGNANVFQPTIPAIAKPDAEPLLHCC